MPSSATTTDRLRARFAGKAIGLSISDNADRTTLGFDRIHQNTFMYKVAQALYRCGASISYGGHLQNEGFTSDSLQFLIDEQQSTIEGQRIRSYVAWPLHCRDAISKDDLRADFLKFADIIDLPAPEEFTGNSDEFLDAKPTPNRYFWFRSLTELRRKMNAEIEARVVLGGKIRGFVGRYPGIIEEVLFAVSTKRPLYICGGFGGAAFALAQLFRGKTAPDLESLSQYTDSQYAASANYYEAATALNLATSLEATTPIDRFVSHAVDYSLLCEFFREVGVSGLNNGLSPQENEILFETPSLDEIRTLVLTGLSRLFAVSPPNKSPLVDSESLLNVAFERAIRRAVGPRSPLINDFQTFALDSADELLSLESELFQVFGDRYRELRQRTLHQIAPTICAQFNSVANARSLLNLDLASLSWTAADGEVSKIAEYFGELSKIDPAVAECKTVRGHLPISSTISSKPSSKNGPQQVVLPQVIYSPKNERMEKIRLLFLAASPKVSPLALDQEIRQITANIRAADYRDSLEVISRWAVRPGDLHQALLEFRPHVLHFSGHGTQSEELVLLDNKSDPKPVSSAAIADLLRVLKDNLRLVVLNACYSRPQAEAITQVIDCAIGMNREVGDEAAITFAGAFYRAIGFGKSIQTAFDLGKNSLLLESIPEENTPNLMFRSGVVPANVVLIHPTENGQSIVNPVSNKALNLWRQKLEYLKEQEAIIADTAQKFAIRMQIEEASAKIRELGG